MNSKQKLRELRSEDLMKLKQAEHRLSECQNMTDVGAQSIEELFKLIDCDNTCYNHFDPLTLELSEYFQTESYTDICTKLDHRFNEFMHFHPIILKDAIATLSQRTCKMSEFASENEVMNNPLYQEAYRHIDAKYQLSRTVGLFEDQLVVISINRKKGDFSERDRQMVEAYTQKLSKTLHSIQTNNHLNHCLQFIYGTLKTRFPVKGIENISITELEILQGYLAGMKASEIASQRGVKPNTIYKQSQMLCEKMGCSSIRRLISSFQEQILEK